VAKRLLTAATSHYQFEVIGNMPLSWVSAFKRALVYFLWLIVWGIIGILMTAIGVYVATNPFINLLTAMMNRQPTVVEPELITGTVVALVGTIIIMLGSTATLIRLVYQLSYEATQEVFTKGKEPATPPTSAKTAAEPKPTPPAAQPTPTPVPVQPTQPTVPSQPAPTPLPAHQKYCAFCGKAIAISARFCPFCQRAQP
jgi:hypothetical protein